MYTYNHNKNIVTFKINVFALKHVSHAIYVVCSSSAFRLPVQDKYTTFETCFKHKF